MENLSGLRSMQRTIAQKIRLEDAPDLKEVKHIGAFDVAYAGNKMVCAAAVLSYPDLELIEKKTIVIDAPMKYIPGYEAFREGPGMLQVFYDLEFDPQILIVDGQGVSHPFSAGLACYVGTELERPVIGVAKKAVKAEVDDDRVLVDGQVRGLLVKTKEHANPLVVSPGHLITIETAAEFVKKLVIPPHKRPEPLHIAGRIAKKEAKKLLSGVQEAE
ncbi:hypothetical protein GF342_06105 [Candidatus Woesearchaeota archaeon]|nr:hypothetical protein [Candidatus Woesearchaeota archaeon]